MLKFFKDHAEIATLVAVVALFQPWLIALWKRFFRKGRVEIYETSQIEVGFSALGATIGLHGTLRALHRDHFVTSIHLVVTRLKDNSSHRLDWGIFRGEKLAWSPSPDALEIPAGFLLTSAQPKRYNIQFHDIPLQEEIRLLLNKLRQAWMDAVRPLWSIMDAGQGFSASQGQPDWRAILHGHYRKFSKELPLAQDTYTALDRLFYWQAGDYALELCVNSSDPSGAFRRRWKFSISQQESDSLRLNTIAILEETCGQQGLQYSFANVKYLQFDRSSSGF